MMALLGVIDQIRSYIYILRTIDDGYIEPMSPFRPLVKLPTIAAS